MLREIMVNLSTVFVFVILCGVVTAIVHKMRKDKKQGKTSCGAGCANCALHGTCHKK